MTANDLRTVINETFTRARIAQIAPPETIEVDRETYEACREAIVANLVSLDQPPFPFVGPHGGLKFKGVEVLVRR
jgi:hypothetical protein